MEAEERRCLVHTLVHLRPQTHRSPNLVLGRAVPKELQGCQPRWATLLQPSRNTPSAPWHSPARECAPGQLSLLPPLSLCPCCPCACQLSHSSAIFLPWRCFPDSLRPHTDHPCKLSTTMLGMQGSRLAETAPGTPSSESGTRWHSSSSLSPLELLGNSQGMGDRVYSPVGCRGSHKNRLGVLRSTPGVQHPPTHPAQGSTFCQHTLRSGLDPTSDFCGSSFILKTQGTGTRK